MIGDRCQRCGKEQTAESKKIDKMYTVTNAFYQEGPNLVPFSGMVCGQCYEKRANV